MGTYDEQREASGRPDVLTYTSEVLKEPLHIAGQPIANLVASTSGIDSDWVVKLIHVYPGEVAGQPNLGGYQVPVAMDIFRGRYRESLADPKPIEANEHCRTDSHSRLQITFPARTSDHGASAVKLISAV